MRGSKPQRLNVCLGEQIIATLAYDGDNEKFSLNYTPEWRQQSFARQQAATDLDSVIDACENLTPKEKQFAQTYANNVKARRQYYLQQADEIATIMV